MSVAPLPSSESSQCGRPTMSHSWEALKSRRNLQTPAHWYDRKIPVELQALPSDEELPKKLKEILTWSTLHLNSPTLVQDVSLVTEPHTAVDVNKDTFHEETGSRSDHENEQQSAGSSDSTQRDVSADTTTKAKTLFQPTKSWRRQLASRYSLSQGLLASNLMLMGDSRPANKPKTTSAGKAKECVSKISATAECTSCFEEFPEGHTIRVPCRHTYCKPCLTSLVITALQNEASYPPKCCLTEIPPQTSLLPLDNRQRELYKEKVAEFAIPSQERRYCPNTQCSKWIPPSKIQLKRHHTYKCPHCSTRVCGICRGTAHRGNAECPQDFALEATMSLAEIEGWRRCYKCRALVEV
jgi:hypothetical protein